MNFKTTIVLIVLLAVAGGVLYFTRDHGGETDKAAQSKQKLFDVSANDVNKLAIASADGKRVVMEKSGGAWRMTEPVNAPAETFEVDGLLRQLVDLESRAKVSGGDASSAATGLANPRHTVEMTTSGGKTHTLFVGEKSAVGDNLFVSTSKGGEAQVVAADILEKLDQPLNKYRDPKLVTMPTPDVKQIILTRPDSKIVLSKSGEEWQIVQPTTMPAEKSEVEDIVFALTGLRAVDFVSEDPKDASYELNSPRMTAELRSVSATQPATAPAATQPVVIRFGRFDDVLKKNVFVTSSQTPVVARVAASVLDSLNKKPIELRDKKVLDVQPDQVSSITIVSDLSATTRPTSRPASKKEISLHRRKELAAPASAPASKPATTQASTGPSTTQASTAPASKPAVAATQPLSKWEFASGDIRPADDAKADSLLSQLHPLRADKFLENPPTTQPTATYTVRLTTEGPGGTPINQHELHFIDPGNNQALRGDYNGVVFEAPRTLVDRFEGDFVKKASTAGGAAPPNRFNGPPTDETGP